MTPIPERLLRCVVAASLLLGVGAPTASARTVAEPLRVAPSPRSLPDRVLVRFRDSSGPGRASVLGRHGLSESDVRTPRRGPSTVKVPPGRTRQGLLAGLAADPDVVYAEPIRLRYVSAYAPPDDPAYVDETTGTDGATGGTTAPYGRSWWLRESGLNAAAAWARGFSDPADRAYPFRAGSAAFKVGVIDTGFHMNHPDRGTRIVAGHDYFDHLSGGVMHEDDDVTPPPAGAPGSDAWLASHGTCTAGEIAAATRNATGVASAGYDAEVRVYKVAGQVYGVPGFAQGEVVIPTDALVSAIYGAVDDGCRVINISLGGPEPDPGTLQAEQEAIDYAWSHGCVVVAATGNDHSGAGAQYPARCDHVVGVGAYGVSGGSRHRARFTNYGEGLDVLAPGELVYGLFDPAQDVDPGGPPGYGYWQGTSMAAPAAAAAIAHLWRYVPSLTNDEIVDLVQRTAIPGAGTQPSSDYGWGYLDMSSAMASITATYGYLAGPVLHVPETPLPGDYTVTWDAVAGRAVLYDVWLDDSFVATTTGTSRSLTLTEGVHRLRIGASSAYDYWDGSSATARTIAVGNAVLTPTDSWGAWQPTGWCTTTTPLVSVQSRDVTSGLIPGTSEYRWSTDASATWSEWASGTLTCLPGSTETETLSARVPFGRDSDTDDLVQFRVTNGSGAVGVSPAFTVRVDSTPPTGTLTLPSESATAEVALTSAVTDDGHDLEMRLSGDAGGTWTPWRQYTAEATVAIPSIRASATVEAQYRDPAGNVLALSGEVFLDLPPQLARLYGGNRYETALRISQEHFARAQTVIVASGASYADALSASALAGSYGGPLLLTTPSSLSSGIAGEIARLGATHAIVVGSDKAVWPKAYSDLDALPGVSVERLWGADRYATSAAIAKAVVAHEHALGRSMPPEYFLARGDDFADALAASPFAYARRMPIVLTKTASVPASTTLALLAVDPSRAATIVIPGGAVGGSVTGALDAAGRRWERIAGDTRYDTAALLVDTATGRGWAGWRYVGIATGESYADGLDGGVATGANGGVMLLTTQASLATQASSRIAAHSHEILRADVFGGPPTISAEAMTALGGLF